MDEWVDEWLGGYVDGWMDGQACILSFFSKANGPAHSGGLTCPDPQQTMRNIPFSHTQFLCFPGW